MEVVLRVKEGPNPGREYRIQTAEADNFLIGREDPSSRAHHRLSPEDRYVSRHHFTLELRPPSTVLLRDHNSKNRTHLRRAGESKFQVVEEAFLHDGDEIRVGRTILTVEIPTPMAVHTPPGGVATQETAPEAFCIRCQEPLPEGWLDSLPTVVSAYDFMCPQCREEVEQARQAAEEVTVERRYVCQSEGCGRDLTEQANRDGRAAELGHLVFYWCQECAERRWKLRKKIDRFWVLRELGEGGMGIVYQAWDEITGRVVALKRLHPFVSRKTRLLLRFQREVAIMGNLTHPNLVRLIGAGEVEGSPFFVSEFLTGGDLWAPVWNRGPLPPREAVGHILQTLEGLIFIHRRKYIHRDIKPQNILLRPKNGSAVAKLGDFGLARSYERHGGTITRTGEYAGTLMFMPPEQILNFKRCGPSVDIYALGVTLYFLLTGEFSLDFPLRFRERMRRDPVQIILSRRPEDQPIPIRDRNPNISPALARVVDQAVQKEADRRYPTAEAFREALQGALS